HQDDDRLSGSGEAKAAGRRGRAAADVARRPRPADRRRGCHARELGWAPLMPTPSEVRVTRRRMREPSRQHSGLLAHAPALGLLVAVALASAGCGSRKEIVYVDPPTEGAYPPVGRSADSHVHPDGAHEPAADVQIGPAESQGSPTAYTPIGSSNSPLVH